eukprot:TRINITY_DN10331_c0_g1_i2.p1 TRINITY_DN10331_c0_g1~~TRINITY_DN10331_c0_g1_i2.p1  ORF type:complete len:244 (-),score=15.37 TRINITY_DN10331_c0_g1_i2:260-991(-)
MACCTRARGSLDLSVRSLYKHCSLRRCCSLRREVYGRPYVLKSGFAKWSITSVVKMDDLGLPSVHSTSNLHQFRAHPCVAEVAPRRRPTVCRELRPCLALALIVPAAYYTVAGVEKLKSEERFLQKRVAEFKTDLTRFSTVQTAGAQELGDVKGEIKGLKGEVAGLTIAVAGVRQTLESQMGAIHMQVGFLHSEVTTLKSETKQQLNALQLQFAAMQALFISMKKQLDAIQAAVSSQTSQPTV